MAFLGFELTIFILCLILITYLIGHSSRSPKNGFFDRFTNKLQGLGVFFIAFSIYLTYVTFNNNYKQTRREVTYKIIDRAWLGINSKLNEMYDKCPNFINSLYFPWQINQIKHNYNTNTNTNYNNNDNWSSIYYLSLLIFQSWEDILTSVKVDSTGQEAWLSIGLQWASFEKLYDVWNISKHYFSTNAINYGDILFKHALNNKFSNSNEVHNYSIKLKNSKEFQDIVHQKYQSI